MVDECYLDLSWLIFSLIKEGGGRLLKAILYRGDLTQIYKNCTGNLQKGCWTQEKSCVWKRIKCVYCTGLDPLFFLLTSGSINNTNAKYSKNFFFSLAHTENTGKRAFFHFCMLGTCLCFDNLEKRSLNWVIFARKGGLNLCLYSCTRQMS